MELDYYRYLSLVPVFLLVLFRVGGVLVMAPFLGATVVPMRRRPSPLADLRALRQLTALFREHTYDLVHTHAAKAGFLGRLAARRAQVGAVVHTPHTFPFERVDTPLRPLYRLLERLAASWADRLVLLAPSQRDAALDARLCDEDRVAVVENGIALPADEPDTLRRHNVPVAQLWYRLPMPATFHGCDGPEGSTSPIRRM